MNQLFLEAYWGGLITAVVFILLMILIFIITRLKKCPSDKIMVIYGRISPDKDGKPRSSMCIHGGVKFIIPIVQSYQFLDLNPIRVIIDLKRVQTKAKNDFLNLSGKFTVGISTEPGIIQNAAERLLGLRVEEIEDLAKDIICGQIRLVVKTSDYEEINNDRDQFLEQVCEKVENEIKRIGLRLISVNISDINEKDY